MALISLTLDTRRALQDGRFPVKIKLSHKTQTKYESTGECALREEWDEIEKEFIGKDALSKKRNQKLKRAVLQMQMALIEIEMRTDISRMSIAELYKEIQRMGGQEPDAGVRVLEYFEATILKKNKPNTADKYKTTLKHLQAYDAQLALRSFEDITVKYVEGFESYLQGRGLRINTVSLCLRSLRSVVNSAIDDEITKTYAFRRFKIKNEPTVKRSLSVEELRELWNIPCSRIEKRYLDMFKLSFLLIGMNGIDMFEAKKDQVIAGRLVYNRAKTGRQYSIKLQPEAMEIIKEYEGKEHLLNLVETFDSHNIFNAQWNRLLKRLGEKEYEMHEGKNGRIHMRRTNAKGRFPKLSSYWARHTWATLAAELDIPKETISGALGHAIGNDVTSIYIRFDQKKIDEANRRVIDYVLGGL